MKYVNYSVVFQEIPDEVSLAINISNCPNNCVGCHSAYLKDNIGLLLDKTAIDKLMNKYKKDVTCFCFMGGDAEPDMVCELSKYIKDNFEGIKTAWYSGKEEIYDKYKNGTFDYIKVGPYLKGFGPLNEKTTNQRLYKINGDAKEDITYKFWKHGK